MYVFYAIIQGIFFESTFGICCSLFLAHFRNDIQFLSCLAGGLKGDREMCFASVDEFPSSS